MKRSSPLISRTPLRRYTPLRAKGEPRPARPVSVPDAVRRLLVARSGGRCELELPGCWVEAVEAHHRISRKMGGRAGAGKRGHDRVSNLIHCCQPCHGWVTGRPAESYGAGWSLREGQDPAQVPVVFGADVASARLVFLDDLGGVHPYEAAAA